MEEGKKTEKKGCFIVIIGYIVLIVGLDIVAGLVGLQAQAAQENVKNNRVWLLECKAPSKTAFVLGIIAVSCLAAAHVIANVIGLSISNPLIQAPDVDVIPKITTFFIVECFLLNWIVGLVGAVFLAIGIWSNRESRSECDEFANKPYLSFGGTVCFIHAIVFIIYYVSSIVAKAGPENLKVKSKK